ncbi:hypothetical protein EMCG_07550 [[Emmonsia] crescens]|uniref:Uncharacterized protein n=1 Tax=[Emmonsia] crescens TaxID=73230 RepID=A0A0G2I923_9EURO|nr:hypothetical protein EMCG_07550 [Emmonsia crescens UAMH 3008]
MGSVKAHPNHPVLPTRPMRVLLVEDVEEEDDMGTSKHSVTVTPARKQTVASPSMPHYPISQLVS